MSIDDKSFSVEDRWELMRKISADKPAADELLRRADSGEATEQDCERFAAQVVKTVEDATKWMARKRGRIDLEPMRQQYERELPSDQYERWHREIYQRMVRLQEEAFSEDSQEPQD